MFDIGEDDEGSAADHQDTDAAASEETGTPCMPTGAVCEGDNECCMGRCDQGICALLDNDEPCELAEACESGMCEAGACVCIPMGGACDTSAGCCENTRCENDGSGQLACLPCGLTGDECAFAGECCGEACVLGVCNACRPMGEPCVVADECCDGLACVDGVCDMCSTGGHGCAQDGDCCSLECVDGGCTCREIGEVCQTSDQCCSGSCNGTCDEGGGGDDGGGSCSPDGFPCIKSSDCCAGQCVYLFPYFFCS